MGFLAFFDLCVLMGFFTVRYKNDISPQILTLFGNSFFKLISMIVKHLFNRMPAAGAFYVLGKRSENTHESQNNIFYSAHRINYANYCMQKVSVVSKAWKLLL